MSFKIDIYTDSQEEQLAHVDMLSVPRIGETIRLILPENNSWWIVVDGARLRVDSAKTRGAMQP